MCPLFGEGAQKTPSANNLTRFELDKRGKTYNSQFDCSHQNRGLHCSRLTESRNSLKARETRKRHNPEDIYHRISIF